MEKIAILILAAGASARMRGADKLLQEVEEKPLLQLMIGRARATGAAVHVTLPGPDHPRAAVAGGAVAVWVPDAGRGMAASIRRGVAALASDVVAVMIVPGDMPELTTADLAAMIAAYGAAPDRVHRATGADGTPGHPVVFPARLFPALTQLSGDAGARSVLAGEDPCLTALPGRHALTDLDTPEDWARWRGETDS